jgi:glycosyltransferase involved in cell wall biosynthesis
MSEPSAGTVEVLLATYNGAAYLQQQLDSLLSQTYDDWRLLVRDDGSADRTVQIVERFRERHPDRVELLRDDDPRLGHVGNFSRLLERSRARYAAFCDQDDVWEPDKLALCMDRMRALERRHDSAAPLLVFTDLSVVDAQLEPIFDSFWELSGLRPGRDMQLGRLLQQNLVTGCTTFFNRALAERAAPIPSTADHHDWWLALVARASGHLEPVARQTVRYRQHGDNLVGARRAPLPLLPVRAALSYLVNLRARKEGLARRFGQAEDLLERLQGQLTRHDREQISAFLRAGEVGVLRRAGIALHHGLMPRGWSSKLSYVLFASSRSVRQPHRG